MARKSKYSFSGTGLSKEDKAVAKKLFNDYRKNYNIDSLSDLQLLEELVYRESRQDSLKKQIAEFEAGNTKSKPRGIETDLDENLQQIIILKDKLGLFEDKSKESPYEYLEELEEKFKKHREQNAGDYSCPCPFCKKMIFFMFKVKNYKAKKHPFYKGKFLTNEYLWKLYKEGRLTAKDLAEVFQTSIDYIKWLDKNLYKD